MKFLLMVIAALAVVNAIKVTDEDDIEFPQGPDGKASTPVEVYKKYTPDDKSESRLSHTVDAFSRDKKTGDNCTDRLDYTQE